MAISNIMQNKLSPPILASLSSQIFAYNQTFKDLSETDLLTLSDVLSPYYPLSDEEKSATLLLRQWLTAKQISTDKLLPFESLINLTKTPIYEWKKIVEDHFTELRYRFKERYDEERYHEKMYNKELYYKMKSEDPTALFTVIERQCQEILAREFPLRMNGPPQIQISQEMANLAENLCD